MYAACGYPVELTWLKVSEAENCVGRPLLIARNLKKYYLETTETPEGHMNQMHKNVL